MATSSPASASPAIRPEAVRTPAFSTRAFCASLQPRFCVRLSVIQRTMPPRKMAKVVSSGRYMPTANNMGLRTCTMMSEMPMKIPTTTSGQGMLPPTIPCASDAIRPACGAESSLSPKPMPPALMFP